jgi:serine/threonine protein kinase
MGNAASNSAVPTPAPNKEDLGESIRLSMSSPGVKPRLSSARDNVVSTGEGQGFYIQPLNDGNQSSSWRDTSGSKRRQRTRKDLIPSFTSPLSSEGSSDIVPIPSLHGSLLRVHKNRDPLRFYEIVKVLGDGSMGSVSKVTKRKSAKGGSARQSFVRREKQRDWCFGLFDPDKCGKFNLFCPIKDEDERQSLSSNDFFVLDSSSKSVDSLDAIDENESNNGGTSPESILKHSLNSQDGRAKHFAKFKSSSIISYVATDSYYALKSIHLERCKDNVFRQELLNEIGMLQRLDHPHIVKALETFDYRDRIYVLLELCSGGDLYTRDPYSEAQACSIIHDILDAVAYMHSRGITHRDLKFENIMFSSPDSDAVKVIDFGLSKKYSQQEHLHETVGTYK